MIFFHSKNKAKKRLAACLSSDRSALYEKTIEKIASDIEEVIRKYTSVSANTTVEIKNAGNRGAYIEVGAHIKAL